MMQGWYWDYPKTANGHNWADTLDNKAATLGNAGFTYLWLPPTSRASFGSGSNGYDVKDLYDLGEFGGGATGFGTRADLNTLIASLNANNVHAVADVIYNHRDGGSPEDNASVEGWIENYNCAKRNAGDNPFPPDRYRCYLPLGGSSGNGAGTYYFKIASASKHPDFYNFEYKIYMQTNTVGFQNLPEANESEPNGGGDCGQPNNTITLGVDMVANIDDVSNCGGWCGTDEFALTIGASDFDAVGDTLWIYLNNTGGYSDHFIYGLWSGGAGADIQNQITYQTYTNFENMPSGRGGMDHTFFKPNGNPTQLSGDWDAMYFFYDYDQQYTQKTEDTLQVWTKWLWENVGFRGFRMDAVKHFDYAFTGDLLDYLHDENIDPGMVVGEFFDTNSGVLNGWINNVEASMDADTKAAIKIRTFDFAMRQALKDACDAFGYDVRNVFNSGMVDGAGTNSYSVVTFVNNHDYRHAGESVQNDPMLAYAYILTNNQIGLPTVFFSDYFGTNVPHYPTVHLQNEIDALIQLHQDYIFQSSSVDYLSRFSTPYSNNYISGFPNTTLLYQLSGGVGGEEVIVAINFAGGTDTLKLDHQINMTNLAVGDTLKDMLGNSKFDYALINGSNQMYIELPPRSYSVWVSAPAVVALPVELADFQVVKNKKNVNLFWKTENEIQLEGFEIERSTDGIRFEKIGWQPATGGKTYASAYHFEDSSVPVNQLLYYRLKMRDVDGQAEFSEVKTIRIQQDISEIKTFPNPTKNNFWIAFDSQKNGTFNLRILDVFGKEIFFLTKDFQNGKNNFPIKIADLLHGIYFLEIKIGQEIFVEKILKE